MKMIPHDEKIAYITVIDVIKFKFKFSSICKKKVN